jgi:hypothetical protein
VTNGYDKLRERLSDLAVSLESIPVERKASYAVAKVYDVLLAKVREKYGDDFIVSVIRDAVVNQFPDSEMTIGAMRAMVTQLQLVVG